MSCSMLSPMRAAEAFTVSRAKCAYRAVVCTCVRSSSFPITSNPSPNANALEAKEWRWS